MKYDWLLFDADDTLFDFSRAEANALKWTIEQSGLPFLPDYLPLYTRFNQLVWKEFEKGALSSIDLRIKRFKLFFDNLGIPIDPAPVSALYMQNLALGVDLLEDAHEVVQTLKKNHHLALVTNGLKDVQRPRLERSLLNDSFEKVFISEELGAAKPSRAFFDAVFTAINQPALEKVLIIGDSLSSDMRGGMDYGIHTCWYNPAGIDSRPAVTYQIKSLRELFALV
jgi:YjjG family noncanonical pyrimidine nucleotidase